MPDTKITALAAITTVDPAADVLPIVDISDTSMAASGTTKKITSNQILGAGGTATLASATITGDLTVDTSTLKVDSANNRVGIGTASPDESLTVAGNIKLNGNRTVIFQTTAGVAAGTVSFKNSSGVQKGAIGSYVNVADEGAVEIIGPTGVSNAVFRSSGNLDLNTGNLVMGVSGKGIDFSATPNAPGATSELLSDYEEGNWTPTVGDSSSGGNQATTATAVGRYTKIGRLVTVQWEVTDINTTGLTAGNAVYIRGLPFSSSSATTQFGTPAVSGVTFSGYLTVGVFSGSSFPIYSSSSGGSLADIKVSALASGTADIWGTLTYIV